MSSLPSTSTLTGINQTLLRHNRSVVLSLVKHYRTLINSIPTEPVPYSAIESFDRNSRKAYKQIEYLASIIHKLKLSPKTPINSPTFRANPSIQREYSVLDRLNLDPPLLRSSTLIRTPEDYSELVEPKTSLECYAQNIPLKNLALKIVTSIEYIQKPIECLKYSQVSSWVSNQLITIPKDTSKFMQYHLYHGPLKLEQLSPNIQGASSVVSKTRLNGQDFALKATKTTDCFLANECALLMTLDGLSPHIITPKAISSLGLFLPYADHSLMTLTTTAIVNDPKQIKNLFLGVAKALSFLHEKGLTHKDVKLENILIIDGKAVLCDFGLTCPTEGDVSKAGTKIYAAPEFFYPKKNSITNKVDSWSFAICLLTIINNGFFKIKHQGELEKRNLGDYLLTSPRKNLNPMLEALTEKSIVKQRDPSGSFLTIIKSCLDINPKERPSMKKIIEQLESMYL